MLLMKKDIPIAEIRISNNKPVEYTDIYDKENLPLGTITDYKINESILLRKWYESRSIPSARPYIEKILSKLNTTSAELFMKSSGISLLDTYWFKKDEDNLNWSDINYHDNGFESVFASYYLTQQFPKGLLFNSPDLTTDGIMDKFWINSCGVPILVKLDYIKDGFLTANEVVYSTIASALGIKTTQYSLGRTIKDGDTKSLKSCLCPSFVTNSNSDYINATQIKHSNIGKPGFSVLDYFQYTLGFDKEIRQMLTLDCLLHNTDRHERNFGYIIDNDEYRFAPLFDNGFCLGANSIINHFDTDRDFKPCPNKNRQEIFKDYDCGLDIDEKELLDILQSTYDDFDISEDIFQKASIELKNGMSAYLEYLKENNKFLFTREQNIELER